MQKIAQRVVRRKRNARYLPRVDLQMYAYRFVLMVMKQDACERLWTRGPCCTLIRMDACRALRAIACARRCVTPLSLALAPSPNS